MKIGIVGTGLIFNAHLAQYKQIDDIKIVALCDCDKLKLKQKSEGLNVKIYTELDDMLNNEKFDIIDICTPTYLHKEHTIKALNKGINVLVEKPAALSSDDAKEMYECSEKNSVKLMVAQVIRFYPEYLKLKDFYTNKTYGNLVSGKMWRLGSSPNWNEWMNDTTKSGGVLTDMSIHDIDFAYYMLGSPKAVCSNRKEMLNTQKTDYISTDMLYQDFNINIESAWYNSSAFTFGFGFRFQFETALVCFENDKLTIYHVNGTSEEIKANTCTVVENLNFNSANACNAYFNEINYFVNCVKNDSEILALNGSDVENVLKLISKIELSTLERKTIEIL